MLNFIGYMLFSGFEYCGIIFLVLSIFNCNLKFYKREFFISVTLATVISYIITIIDSQIVILFIAPLLILCLRFLFKVRTLKSIIVILGGLTIYLAMQFGISQFAIHYNYLKMSDMNNAFAVKSYVMQTLSSIIAITISTYLRIFNAGFGFSLRSKKNPYKLFLITSIVSFTLSVLCFIAFSSSQRISFFNICGSMLVVSSIAIFFLSHKRDAIEYSYK